MRAPAEEGLWARYRGWLLLIALVHTVAGHVAFSDMNPDKVMQITAARSLLDRGQLTLAVVDPVDLSTRWEPLVGWPLGYSVLIAALLKATGEVWISTILMDAFMAGLCVIAWFVIVERAGSSVSPGPRIHIWLWWGLLFGPAMAPLPSSDLAALSALSVAILLLTPRPGGPPARPAWIALAGLCTGVAASLRYAYWPFLALGPLLYAALAAGSTERRKNYAAGFVVATLVSCLSLGLLVVAGRVVTGHATNLTSPAFADIPGWYFSNLARLYPFPSAALGLDAPFNALFFKLGWRAAVPLLWIPGLAILLAGLRCLPRNTWDEWRKSPDSHVSVIGVIGVITLLLTLGQLCWLSLRHPLVAPAFWTLDGDWTYVEEGRYFAPLFPLIGIAALRGRASGEAPLRRVLGPGLGAMAVGVAAWRLWVWGSLVFEWPERRWSNPAFRAEMKTVEEAARPFRDGSGIYVDYDASRLASARMAGSPMMRALPAAPAQVSRPLTVIMAVRRSGQTQEPPNARRVASLADADLWKFQLLPGPSRAP